MAEEGSGLEVDLGGSLHLAIGGLEKSTKRLAQALQYGTVDLNRDKRVPAAGGTIFIDLGGPARGYKWELRRLIVGGATWSTTVGGIANLNIMPALAADTIAGMVDNAPSLPDVAFYGGGEVVVRASNHLFVVIVGGDAGVQYNATGMALEFVDRPTVGYVEE